MGSHNVYLNEQHEDLLAEVVKKVEEEEGETITRTQYCQRVVIERLNEDKKRFKLED